MSAQWIETDTFVCVGVALTATLYLQYNEERFDYGVWILVAFQIPKWYFKVS
jgi:hypothetical protein